MRRPSWIALSFSLYYLGWIPIAQAADGLYVTNGTAQSYPANSTHGADPDEKDSAPLKSSHSRSKFSNVSSLNAREVFSKGNNLQSVIGSPAGNAKMQNPVDVRFDAPDTSNRQTATAAAQNPSPAIAPVSVAPSPMPPPAAPPTDTSIQVTPSPGPPPSPSSTDTPLQAAPNPSPADAQGPAAANPNAPAALTPAPGPAPSAPGPAPDIINTLPSNPVTTEPTATGMNIQTPIPPTGDGINDPNGKQVGIQALQDEIQAQGLASVLMRENVAVLFQDGDVKIDAFGNMHQFADTVSRDAANQLSFINANMLSGQPATLNWQTTRIAFNQPLPDDYTQATRTAFSTLDATPPAYWATDVATTRSNTVDSMNVTADGGTPVFAPGQNRYFTTFPDQQASINGVTLYQQVAGNIAYLGGGAPAVTVSNAGGANTSIQNLYPDGTAVERDVMFVDGNGSIVSPDSLPSGQGALDFVNGLYVHDTIFSAQLMSRPITTFGSAPSRILAGLDSIRTEGEALNILQGGVVQGAPDGLFHN